MCVFYTISSFSFFQVNQLDQQTTGKVVDILINYETVVQFNNQALDLHSYDALLLDYQKAAVHLEYVSAALNGGQSVIIAVGLGAVMAMAGLRVGAGSMTIGDLVLVNGLVLQLSLPLQVRPPAHPPLGMGERSAAPVSDLWWAVVAVFRVFVSRLAAISGGHRGHVRDPQVKPTNLKPQT